MQAHCYTSRWAQHFCNTRRYTSYAGSMPALHSLHFFSIFTRIETYTEHMYIHVYVYINIEKKCSECSDGV